MDAPRALWTESFTRTSLAAVTQGARAANDRDLGKRWLSVLEASVSCPTVVNGSQQTERLVLRFVVAADNGGTEVGRTSEFPDARVEGDGHLSSLSRRRRRLTSLLGVAEGLGVV